MASHFLGVKDFPHALDPCGCLGLEPYGEESVHYVVQTCHVTGVSAYVLRTKSSFSVCMKPTLTLKLPRASDHSYAE